MGDTVIKVSDCHGISEAITALPATHTSDFAYQLYFSLNLIYIIIIIGVYCMSNTLKTHFPILLTIIVCNCAVESLIRVGAPFLSGY